MKIVAYPFHTVVILIVVLTLTAAIGTAIFNKPVLFKSLSTSF